ncbi:type 1 fimbrial protein [Deefgea tanakiae]|uniref:Type 1 fimbrial protein n=1 Tax=Deefgea tanakiae TaxID=2865840 RepID=A0ABX8Z8L1_9NEIS|nr:fimbrial protein [Deefgea tanakiae]QZA78916.1 type 1 fimbrial protein [Deefgea tanakiae]
MINLAKSALVVALASPLAVFASDGAINIDGMVTSTTCSINGADPSGNNTIAVTLPTVSVSALKKFDTITGVTPIKIVLGKPGEAGCTNGKVASLHFENDPAFVDYAGRLRNLVEQTPTGAKRVVVQLKNFNGGSIWVNQIVTNKTSAMIVNNTATLDFFAGYYSYGADATPGLVKSAVQFSVVYN